MWSNTAPRSWPPTAIRTATAFTSSRQVRLGKVSLYVNQVTVQNCWFVTVEAIAWFAAGYNHYSGYRTILAYAAPGHFNRINRYSSPAQTCQAGQCFPAGAALGDNTADNVRLITENRFALQFQCGICTITDIAIL